jgi:scyllo-inositol 2-dehydrogenase (NAD+)
MNRLKTVVIGLGRMGAHTAPELRGTLPPGWLPLNHVEAVASLPGLELAGVCDLDGDRAESVARDQPGSVPYTDYQRAIDDLRPDIVTVATRTPGRVEIIEYVCARGVRGIHVEKPLAGNMADCRRALEAVRRSGAHLGLGTYRRFMPLYRQARQMIKSGAIGEVIEVAVEHGRTLCCSSPAPPPWSTWRPAATLKP